MPHQAQIRWELLGGDFLKRRYTREHVWQFDGGLSIPASASPHIVPSPWSNPTNVDPEEAFVASVSSCHLLWFLHVACDAGLIVESYQDNAVGMMTENANGVMWISRVTLRPCLEWGNGSCPSADEIIKLHRLAHEKCFIAASIRSEVIVEPVV